MQKINLSDEVLKRPDYDIHLSIGIPESFQRRMSAFQNLNTVHPSEPRNASFFESRSCQISIRWLPPSTSIAIFRSGKAKSR